MQLLAVSFQLPSIKNSAIDGWSTAHLFDPKSFGRKQGKCL
jgi:hypothetical protein